MYSCDTLSPTYFICIFVLFDGEENFRCGLIVDYSAIDYFLIDEWESNLKYFFPREKNITD